MGGGGPPRVGGRKSVGFGSKSAQALPCLLLCGTEGCRWALWVQLSGAAWYKNQYHSSSSSPPRPPPTSSPSLSRRPLLSALNQWVLKPISRFRLRSFHPERGVFLDPTMAVIVFTVRTRCRQRNVGVHVPIMMDPMFAALAAQWKATALHQEAPFVGPF